MNLLKICIAFCNFVENHKTVIRDGYFIGASGTKHLLNLELVIKLSYPKTSKQLIEYIRERKEVFKTHGESIDYVETETPTNKTIKELVCA